MGYALLWLEFLGIALVFLAVITAWASHARGPRMRRRVPALIGAMMILLVSLATAFFGEIHFDSHILTPGFWYAVLWSSVFTITTVVLLTVGLRKGVDDWPRARDWPLRRLVLALLGLFVLAWITFANLDTAVTMRLATVRAEGNATILSLAPAPIPAGANAAPLYLDAFELMAPETPPPSTWVEKTHGWEAYDGKSVDPKNKAFLDFLQTQQPALSLLREGAARPGCRIEREYSLGFDMLIPEVRNFRRGATLLAYDALAAAAAGNSRRAMQDVAAIFGIARQLDEPLLLCLLMSVGIEETGFSVLQDVLDLAPPTKEDLELISLHPSERYRTLLQRAIMMEEAVGLTSFGMLALEPLPHFFLLIEGGRKEDYVLAGILGSSFYRVFMLSDDLKGFRHLMEETRRECQRPHAEAMLAVEAVDRQWRRKRGILAGLMTPALIKCFTRVSEAEAMHRLSRLGLAATAYRLKHGKLPTTPDALIPDFIPRLPVDPFDGKPMRMKTDGPDLVFYSIGPDQKDDGGKKAETRNHYEGDLVFRLKGK
jgi:hypothetical protein